MLLERRHGISRLRMRLVNLPDTAIGQSATRILITSFVFVASITFALIGSLTRGHAASACTQGVSMNIVAHEDDDILFLSPRLLHDIDAGRCVRTVFITA